MKTTRISNIGFILLVLYLLAVALLTGGAAWVILHFIIKWW